MTFSNCITSAWHTKFLVRVFLNILNMLVNCSLRERAPTSACPSSIFQNHYTSSCAPSFQISNYSKMFLFTLCHPSPTPVSNPRSHTLKGLYPSRRYRFKKVGMHDKKELYLSPIPLTQFLYQNIKDKTLVLVM